MMPYAGPICAFISSVTWALASSSYSRLANHAHPFAINFTRAFVGLPFFILAVLIESGGFSGAFEAYSQISGASFSWLVISMIASFGIGDSLFFWATLSLGVPGALAIASAYPAWTVLFTAMQTGQWLPVMQIAGLFITLCGVITVIMKAPKNNQVQVQSLNIHEGVQENTQFDVQGFAQNDFRNPARQNIVLRGVIFSFIASFCWAMNSYSVMRGSDGHSALLLNAVRMAIAMLVTAISGMLYARKQPIWISRTQLKNVYWIMVIEVFIGSFCYVYGMSNSPLVLGATLASLAPVISVPIAWSLKLEKPSGWRAFGVSLVVLGLILLVNE